MSSKQLPQIQIKMYAIFIKEINAFFSSVIGYVVIGVFILMTGLLMWVFPDFSILDYEYATLDQLFSMGPIIFLFLIPAICMRSFAEEQQPGTIELLVTRPISDLSIYYSVHQLGSPPGNLDSGGVIGSYFGLVMLAAAFVAIGLLASSLTRNQIVAFILGTVLCFLIHWGFELISTLPVFVGKVDDVVQMFGINYHYNSISRGLIDTRDLIYFISIICFFIAATVVSLGRRKW